MNPLPKPSAHSNLYHATMRSPSFGLLSRNQITRLDLRERVLQLVLTPIARYHMSTMKSNDTPAWLFK